MHDVKAVPPHSVLPPTTAPTDGSIYTFVVQTVVCGNISGELVIIINESSQQGI